MITLTKKKPTFAARKRSMDFTITIVKNDDWGYTAQCDQVPNAITEGETIAEIVSNMRTLIPEMLDANKRLTKRSYRGRKTVSRKVSIE